MAAAMATIPVEEEGGISSGVPEAVRTNVAKPSPSETKETDWRMSGGGRETVAGQCEDNSSASAIFSLVYAALLGIAVFGLAIAGTTTPRWVTYRRITMQGQTPAMEFYHSGLWSDCGPMGCVHDNTNSARGYVRVARAFAILLIVLSFSLSFIHLPIVAAIAGRRTGRAHSNNAKFAGMCWLFTAACGIISMSAFYDRRSRELLFDRSINHVFWDWSFGTFTAAWALALGLVAPLCFIAA